MRAPRRFYGPPIALTVALTVALGGCMRSDSLATLDLDCGEGARVVIDASALCVYLDTPPDDCPEPLPHRFEADGATACVREAHPAPGLVERAIARVRAGDAGVRPADGGPRPVDGGLFPVDGGVFIVDFGGAADADF